MDTALFLIHDLRMGGAEKTFIALTNNIGSLQAIPVVIRRPLELAEELRRDKHVFDLSAPEPSSFRPEEWTTSSHLPEPRAADAVPRWIGGELTSLARKCSRLNTLAGQSGAQLISTFLHKSHVLGMFTKLFLRWDLKVVLNVHELMSQHLHYHFTNPIRRWVMRAFVRFFFPRADLVVAVAEGVKRDLVEAFGVPAHRIKVIPNPLDLEWLRVQASEGIADCELPPPDGPLVLAVGRLVKLKAHDILVEAFAQLPAACRGHLLILGEGEERSALEELVQTLGLRQSVTFTGAVKNPWKYMTRADVLVLPSLSEAFPNVIGEALALGLPVVASDCAQGVREYLSDGSCGFLVPPGSVPELVQGITKVLTDEPLREMFIERGLRRVEEFDLRRVVQTYEQTLSGLL
jgi:glycosyltransferase involved in cell wall biosynthesis